MKKLGMIGVSAALGLLLSPINQSMAAEHVSVPHKYPTPYLGASGVFLATDGFSRTLTDGTDFDTRNVADIDNDNHTVGFRGYGGLSFNKYFAIEGGYTTASDKSTSKINETTSVKNNLNIFDVQAKVTYPLPSIFSLYAKGGLAYVMSDVTGDSAAFTNDAPFANTEVKKVLPMFGLGFGVKIYQVEFTAYWSRIQGRGDIHTIDYAGFGAEYYFG